MTRNLKRAATVLGVAAVTSVGLVACSDSNNAGGNDGADVVVPEGLSGATGTLAAEGASSQKNAMEILGPIYSQAVEGAQFNYTSSGSGAGRKAFIGNQVAFAGSDSPLKEEQVEQAKQRCGGNEAWHLPFVIGPVAIAYNLEGVDDLNLSVDTIAKIFKGEIKKWNDPAIAGENEGVELPDENIGVVYRSDESGTSDNFQKFLKAAAPDVWETEGQEFPQAVGEGAEGSTGVATQVKNIPGGITYVEAGYAKQNDLGVANVDFGSGPVELTDEAVNKTLENLEFKGEGHDMVVNSDALFSQKAEGEYPLILTTYEIVCSAGYDENTANQVKDFLTVALENQDAIAQYGFVPVKGSHHDRLAEAIKAINA
ncbi:phosphate ABC transporter substrate-binding protein PstS [Corynebacterium tapiri]|uniref:Phosphate-binding protein n=1 Tax=Corynebacterium tapiri TaxID=1448266 RepID=A0A5C4U3V7_9CORY|nr:phosphate ABC transporter substrate-binding protein PstS [Corynebacterium tapiri]TNL96109.1 phosphate ABC transporter substrate-binding protein PstS [Corynebacterium tapiri]